MIKNVFPAIQPRRPACHHHALVEAWPRLRHRGGLQIHVNVIRDEQIKPPIAVIVHEGATRIPAIAFARDARLLADIGERAIAVIVIKHILPKVRDEQIVPSVIIVVADANALAPARACQSRL